MRRHKALATLLSVLVDKVFCWSGGAAIGGIVIVGIALRLLQFGIRRSLYLDEAALSLSIRDRGWIDLFTRPLDHAQTAAPGYLAVQKLAMLLMGTGEQAQRVIPLLAGLASVPLFYYLARRFLHGTALVVVMVLFAVSVPLVFSSANAKPYVIDLLAAVVLLGLGARLGQSDAVRPDAIVFACVAAVAALLSQPSVLLTAGILSGLMVLSILPPERHRMVGILVAGAIWTVGAFPAAIHALGSLDPSARAYMMDFWAAGFAPLPPASLNELLWYPQAIFRLIGDTLRAVPTLPLVFLFSLGMIITARRRPLLFALMAGPILITILASAALLYPWSIGGRGMSGRVLLFLAPVVLLAIGQGLSYLTGLTRHQHLRTVIAVIAAVPILLPALLVLPMRRDELRPALEYMRAARQPGEALYIYYGARHVFSFYRTPEDSTIGPLVLGRCSRDAPWRYADEITSLAGYGRAWVVVAHPVIGEDAIFTSLLDALGERQAAASWPGATAMLYDFTRTSGAVLPAIPPAPARWVLIGCRGIHETLPE